MLRVFGAVWCWVMSESLGVAITPQLSRDLVGLCCLYYRTMAANAIAFVGR